MDKLYDLMTTGFKYQVRPTLKPEPGQAGRGHCAARTQTPRTTGPDGPVPRLGRGTSERVDRPGGGQGGRMCEGGRGAASLPPPPLVLGGHAASLTPY